MKTILNKSELLPLSMTVSIVVAFFVTAVGIPHNLYADPDNVQPNTKGYTILGREYQENGIIFDIPKEDDPSRDVRVVSFPNHAVIPSYINVGGTRYTVRTVVGPQTIYGDTTGWVTLPPTVKYCHFGSEMDSSPIGKTFSGVANVNITDLDSFLNMDYFHQNITYRNSGYDVPDNLGWKLYLNGQELKDYDYVYPEGSPLGTSLANLEGVRSITIPASDTVRKQPQDLWYTTFKNESAWAEYLKFKADSGYDLRYYAIPARHIVFPRNMKEFYGYGTVFKYATASLKVARWPENLEYFASDDGLASMYVEDLPKTVTRVGGDGYFCSFHVADILTIPKNWTNLGKTSFSRKDNYHWRKITIEDSDQPLHISGEIRCYAEDSLSFYIGRNLVVENDRSYFQVTKSSNKTATIIIGDKVTEMTDRLPVKLTYDYDPDNVTYPKYLYCMGLTPPNFKTALPEILDWKFETVLVVPEAAEQAYRNHPVWKYFYIILTHGVDEINTDKEVAKETWYSLDGKLLGRPEPGKINIRVTTYIDGTTRSHKVAVPQE